jgi:hypothetical protein
MSHFHRFRDVAVGSSHSADFPVLVAPVHLPFADMMLGVDYFRHRKLWLAYAGGLAFIQ